MTNPDIGGSYAGVVINKAGVGNIYAATDTGSDGTASVVLNLSRRNGSYDGPQIVLDRGGWAKASIAGLQGGNTASSAAGHFAIYTHNAGAGTRDERLRITGDNGHCGIGTIDPYAPLTIMGSAETNGTNIADHGIMLHAPGALHQDVIGITASFENSGMRPRAGIGFISHPTADPIEGYAGEIGFYTRDAADGSALGAVDERMRIHRNGDISIASTNAHGSLTIGYDTGSSLATYADNGQEGLTFNVDRIDSDNYLGTCDMVVNRSSDATNGGTQFRFFTQPRTTGNPINVLTLTREGVTERSSRNANVRTYEFSYTDGAGGSGQNKNLFTVNADGNSNTTLVFNLDYVGNYGAASDQVTTGQWIGGIRRADSGTTWNATTPQLVGENGSGDSDLDVSWSSDTLQANASAWMGWTVFVRVTVYNGSITINC